MKEVYVMRFAEGSLTRVFLTKKDALYIMDDICKMYGTTKASIPGGWRIDNPQEVFMTLTDVEVL